jgi:hypothetical protein
MTHTEEYQDTLEGGIDIGYDASRRWLNVPRSPDRMSCLTNALGIETRLSRRLQPRQMGQPLHIDSLENRINEADQEIKRDQRESNTSLAIVVVNNINNDQEISKGPSNVSEPSMAWGFNRYC